MFSISFQNCTWCQNLSSRIVNVAESNKRFTPSPHRVDSRNPRGAKVTYISYFILLHFQTSRFCFYKYYFYQSKTFREKVNYLIFKKKNVANYRFFFRNSNYVSSKINVLDTNDTPLLRLSAFICGILYLCTKFQPY